MAMAMAMAVSAMFPMIPHHLSRPAASKGSQVLAAEDLPLGTVSGEMDVAALVAAAASAAAAAAASSSQPRTVLATLTPQGLLDEGAGALVVAMRLAPDCHSCNVLLSPAGLGKALLLRTVRLVRSGEELLLWFADAVQSALAVPFLSPFNIQDETRYECHRCGCHFESPNPLKIHLSLDCGRQPLSRLWSRLLLTPPPLSPPTTALLGGGAGGESAFRPYAPSDTLHRQVEALASNLGKAARGSGHLCIYCGKVYSRKYGLKIHIRTHTGYKPLKCKVCMRAFGDPSNLNKHIRLHAEGDTPYRCELCGKVLVRRRDLDRHLKSRHCTWTQTDEAQQQK